MWVLTIMIFFSLCFCGSGLTLADNATTNAVVQGNQGYIYGTPPKADDNSSSDANTAQAHPIGDIINAIETLDAWIRQNLW